MSAEPVGPSPAERAYIHHNTPAATPWWELSEAQQRAWERVVSLRPWTAPTLTTYALKPLPPRRRRYRVVIRRSLWDRIGHWLGCVW